jgi:hydroxymethylpyrimidine pyrophosphatase-like HAD family hydrolase
MKKRLVLGIDFDGTIVEEAFPEIGKIKPKTVQLMQEAIEAGHLLIVWTARSGQAEIDAINFLNENNIPYHYVNENPEDPYAIRGEQGRKIFCDYYLDDRALHVNDIDKLFEVI